MKESNGAIFDLTLSGKELEVIYVALSKVSFFGVDDNAQSLIRYKIERLIEEDTGLSLHDHLQASDAIPEHVEHPDERSSSQ